MDQQPDAPERPPRQEPRSLKAMDWRSPGAAPSPARSDRPQKDASERPPRDDDRSQRGNFPRSVGNWRSPNPSPRDTSSPSRSANKTPREGHAQGQRWRDRPSNSEGAKETSTFRNSDRQKNSLVDDSSALQEGRRIYLGNILYHVRPDEITQALEREGFKNYEQVHISIDPVSGRNPGYCFVEFDDRETADKAIDALSGVEIHGRPLKTGPCNPKTSRGPPRREGGRSGGSGGQSGGGGGDNDEYEPTFNRWGDFSGGKHGASLGKSGPDAAQEHLAETLDDNQRTRLYVGGLGKMINQEHNDREMREIFSGFKVMAISKRITANPNTRHLPGSHNFCFVDFETHDEANRARRAINGVEYMGTKLKVNPAKHNAPPTIEHSAAVHDLAEEFLGRRVDKAGP